MRIFTYIDRLKRKRARRQRLKAQSVLGITSSELFAIRMMKSIDKDDVLIRRHGTMVVQPPDPQDV